jgi:hypothetical protein
MAAHHARRHTILAGRDFCQGDHICTLFDTVEEQLAVAAEYIADGLARNERCMYVSHPKEALENFRQALGRQNVDVAAAESSGALLILPTAAAHLVDGHFDSERMLAMLNSAVEEALDAGFTGLRTCGDMSWLLDSPPGAEQVVEYEGLLNQYFHSVRALGMCQYDRTRLPAGLLDHALATHPSVVIAHRHRDNPHYRPWPESGRLADPGRELDRKLSVLRSTAS